jgi:hypothetical protein
MLRCWLIGKNCRESVSQTQRYLTQRQHGPLRRIIFDVSKGFIFVFSSRPLRVLRGVRLHPISWAYCAWESTHSFGQFRQLQKIDRIGNLLALLRVLRP